MRAGIALQSLRASISLIAFVSLVAFGAFDVHGLGIGEVAVVSPAQIPGAVHGGREHIALRAALSSVALLALVALWPLRSSVAFVSLFACVAFRPLLALRPGLAGYSLRPLSAGRAGVALRTGGAGLTRRPLWADVARVAFFALYALRAGSALRPRVAGLAFRPLLAGIALGACGASRAGDVHRIGVRKGSVVRPSQHTGLHVHARREGRAAWACRARLALSACRAGVAFGEHEVQYRMSVVADVRDGGNVALRYGAYFNSRGLARRPLHQFGGAYVCRQPAGSYQISVYHSATSETASYTARASGLSTPITSPPVNFTRMSSVTEPFAGNENVSA